VESHGWYSLKPFNWDSADGILRSALCVNGKPTDILFSENNYVIDITSTSPITDTVRHTATRMLCLNDDLSDFHHYCNRHQEFKWIADQKLGRMLRSTNLWEDTVKVLCTTNINWSGTQSMISSLVTEFGEATPHGNHTFPSAKVIANTEQSVIKSKTSLGYRSEALCDLARSIDKGHVNIDSWDDSNYSTEEIRSQILALKGFGPYAAASILAITNRFDYLPVDSVFINHVANKYFKGNKPKHRIAEKVYAKWDRWKYLAYWFDKKH